MRTTVLSSDNKACYSENCLPGGLKFNPSLSDWPSSQPSNSPSVSPSDAPSLDEEDSFDWATDDL